MSDLRIRQVRLDDHEHIRRRAVERIRSGLCPGCEKPHLYKGASVCCCLDCFMGAPLGGRAPAHDCSACPLEKRVR